MQTQLSSSSVAEAPANFSEKNLHAEPDVLLVRKGAKVFPLEAIEIACIYKDSNFNYVRTFKEEAFIIDRSLEEIEKCLNANHFFRANRQTIVNLRSIQSYAPVENGKLNVVLKSSLPPIIVSQKRAPDFRTWIKGNKA